MSSILRGNRPDLTPAQVVGVLAAGIPILANLLHAFGVYDVSPEQQQALQDAVTWGGVLAGVLFAADAGLRASRNAADSRRHAATVPAAAVVAAAEPVAVAGATAAPSPTPTDDREPPPPGGLKPVPVS
jgi:hypothetical protein